MSNDRLNAEDRERMRTERDALKAELAQRVEQVETLSRELAETNSGVVALYAELDDKAQQLREASELKSRFLSYMSHEFRTPLGSIRSLTRILLDRLDGPLTPEQEKQVSFIQSSTQELSEMVNDLLDLAKIEAGRISISPAWFELVDLFAALRGMFKPMLKNPQVALVFEEPVGLPRAFTDDKKIAQILRNFISNALKFTRQGEVRVSASRPGRRPRFGAQQTAGGIARRKRGGQKRTRPGVDFPRHHSNPFRLARTSADGNGNCEGGKPQRCLMQSNAWRWWTTTTPPFIRLRGCCARRGSTSLKEPLARKRSTWRSETST